MAIDPNLVSTARVGELPIGVVNLSDKIPHETGTELYQATVQDLADAIGDYLNTLGELQKRSQTYG